MTDKPLHVRVAEALGWSGWLSKHGHFIVTHGIGADHVGDRCEYAFGTINTSPYDSQTGKKRPERTEWWEDCPHIPAYDTDWSATGPLIEKYVIQLSRYPAGWLAGTSNPEDGFVFGAEAVTPLIAVCNLILALAEAGKLKAA